MDGQNNNLDNNTSLQEETNSNKSFVKKVKSHVSELLSTSFGKWFSGDTNIRHRVYDEDDDNYEIQPPSKRVKIPTPESKPYTNSLSSEFNNFSPISSRIETQTRGNIFDSVAGPSGLQQKDRSATIRLFNGDKESESGESDASSVSRLRNTTETRINFHTPPSTHSRSLFTDRPYNSQLNTSLSSKRPSFNASTFGSPNFVDRTLSTKQILSSPFYSGRTVYGGASAYSARQKSAPDRPKSQIQVKPVNNSVGNDVSLSKTARRILNALEEFNPVTDAKKIPYPKQRVRPEGILSKYAGANPYVTRERKIPFALNKELHVPTVPDLLKMKLKERLQDSTVAVRQIATTSKSVLNRDDYKIRSKEDDVPKHSNKMKNKLTATRQKNDNQQIEEVKLPAVTLPITTLPKFDFSLPPPPSSAKQPLVTVACNEPPKSTTPTSSSVIKKKADAVDVKDQVAQFEFSNPLILADNLKSIIAINDFKFSDPVFKQRDKSAQDVGVNFKVSTSENFTLKRKNQGVPPVIPKLSKGSVEDVFNTPVAESLDKFKPAAALWECNVCLIRNTPDKLKCAACEAAKPGTEAVKSDGAAKTAPSFGDQFKPPSSTWECPTCLIRNKDEVEKCVACETVKPGSKSAAPSGFGFGDAFKKKGNEWECSVCMIRNNEDKTVCQACETPKPGTKVDEKPAKTVNVATFNFGIFPTTASLTKTTGTETVQTPSFSLPSTSVVTSTSTIPTFTFGIPATSVIPPTPVVPATPVTESKKVIEPLLPIAKVSEPSTMASKPVNDASKAPVSSGIFVFSVPPKVSATVSDLIQSEATKPTVLSTSPSAFTFGKSSTAITPSLKRSAADSDSAAVENKKPSSAITFQPPAINSPITPKPAVSQPTTTSSSFMFTPTPTQSHPTTTASTNLFTFGPTKTTASSLFGNTVTTTQSPVFNFSHSEKPAPTQPTFGGTTEKQPALPMFGSPSSNSLFGSAKSAFDVPPSTQPFGSVASTVFGSEPKPLMTSFADSPKSQSLFGMEPKPSLFGATEPKAPSTFGTEPSAPLFGADPKSTPFGSGTEQKAPIFGTGSDQKPPSIFGTDQKPATFGAADNKPFTFGPPSNDTAAKSQFAFGAKPPEPNKSFFGAATPASTPAAGGFNFNSTVTPTTFNFSAPKIENALPFQSAPSAGNIFNAAPVQPQQQQAQPLQNGGFNFGTPANASTGNKTGFNFGATNQFTPAAAPAPNAAPSATTGFWGMTNNTNANPAATASGFNFGQTAPAQAPPSFNANIKPNFNFTAGNMVTGFSATPENSPVTQRRRLKAVRRNPR
ncbi:hypothetical protein PPYR_01350 [Photinus pyralis]|uniref:Nuclear pore complex protein Nup153 n=3 Tax=Photinus pyralis TaxID=7054 RepID=A0A5N4B4U2_PHOPY|nr:nuclear pore complex protein Nup153-like [Photinus pyralis]KAB0804380.1 hypothetical protein PPYR_01350 [Photinus pyralis]